VRGKEESPSARTVFGLGSAVPRGEGDASPALAALNGCRRSQGPVRHRGVTIKPRASKQLINGDVEEREEGLWDPVVRG